MKEIGIGTDIEDIKRFKKLSRIKDKIFLKKIYTGKELDYCYSKKSPGQHLAARFAGKESIVKALSSISIKSKVSYNDIEITSTDDAPKASLNKFKNVKIKISLSHCKDKALAFAIVMKK
ncbi:MAG: holo-ACP synthase [Nanoarchaeota archaeon]